MRQRPQGRSFLSVCERFRVGGVSTLQARSCLSESLLAQELRKLLPPWKATPTAATGITEQKRARPASFTLNLAELRVHFNERLV